MPSSSAAALHNRALESAGLHCIIHLHPIPKKRRGGNDPSLAATSYHGKGQAPGRLMVQGRGEQASTTGGRHGGQAEPARPLEGLRSVQLLEVSAVMFPSTQFGHLSLDRDARFAALLHAYTYMR
ncbi:hypothetical protein PVAP13_9KG633401 [Panicum virgatum]|uniref:Uncharacterized protein n=1 Tax=Panicum virgatum TaxID=38727 RepID=A0A8T0P5L0_PANVG|nr:hypothetical protein PVAP13_9KG633401 [Panicum virgatum]